MANSDPEPRRGDQGAAPFAGRNVELERQNPDLLVPPTTDSRLVPNLKFSFSQAHTRVEKGGWTREVTNRDLPIASQLSGVQFGLEPGAYREIHWHQQSEWAYMLSGSCRISAVDHEGRNFIEDVKAGDLWFFPQGVPHNIQALENGAQFLLVFDDGAFSENNTFLLSDFFAHASARPGQELRLDAGPDGKSARAGEVHLPGRRPTAPATGPGGQPDR